MVFEIQQNSDVTFRLSRLGPCRRQDGGSPRALQVDKALACIDFAEGPVCRIAPVVESSTPVEREKLFDCEHFRLWRLRGRSPFDIGVAGLPRVLVCIGVRESWSMQMRVLLLQKGTYFCCRQLSQSAPFDRAVR